MRRQCLAHVALAAECHIFVRRQLCAMRRERSSNGDVLRRQHSLRIGADRAICLDRRLRREGCLAFARDVVCIDVFVRLRVQIAADVQVTCYNDSLARFDVRISGCVHRPCPKSVTCVQHSIAARTDVLCRQFILCLNRQLAVCTDIAVKPRDMGFQRGIRLGRKVFQPVCVEVVMHRHREVLVRGEVCIEVDILRLHLHRAAREHCRIRLEHVLDCHREIAARGDRSVDREFFADICRKFSARGNRAVRYEILFGICRKCSARRHSALRLHTLARKRYVFTCGDRLLRRKVIAGFCREFSARRQSAFCRQVISCRQHGIPVAADFALCRQVARLCRECDGFPARDGINVHRCLCHSVKRISGAEVHCRDVPLCRRHRGLAGTLDVIRRDVPPRDIQVAADIQVMYLDIPKGFDACCFDRAVMFPDDAHIVYGEILLRRQDCTANRRDVMRIDLQRRSVQIAARRDVMHRQLIVHINGQRSACAYIGAEAGSTGFQFAVRLHEKVHTLVYNKLVLCRDREVLIRSKICAEFDILRIHRCRAP